MHLHGYAFSPYALPTALTALAVIGFGTTVLVQRSSRVSAAFFTVTMTVAMWLGAFSMIALAVDPGIAMVWARLSFLAIPFIAPAMYQFSVEMLRVSESRRIAVRLGWIIALLFAITGLLTDAMIPDVARFSWGYFPRFAPRVAVAFIIFFVGYLLAALGEFIRALPKSLGVERLRIKLLILSMAIAYFACVDFVPGFGVALYPFGYGA